MKCTACVSCGFGAKSFYKVMKKFPYKGETTQDIKVKLDKELGFGTGDYSSYYYTMIRYLTLALEDMKGKLKNEGADTVNCVRFIIRYSVEKCNESTFIRLKNARTNRLFGVNMLNYVKSIVKRGNVYGTKNVKQITEMEREEE